MEDSIIKEAEGKLLAAELVRCMIALSADFGAIQKGQIEIELTPYSQLLSSVLSVVASGRLSQESVIKLMHRCNHNLFTLAEISV